jgi:hypothetical protein
MEELIEGANVDLKEPDRSCVVGKQETENLI